MKDKVLAKHASKLLDCYDSSLASRDCKQSASKLGYKYGLNSTANRFQIGSVFNEFDEQNLLPFSCKK